MLNEYKIEETYYNKLIEYFKENSDIEVVYIGGSRAINQSRLSADIDLFMEGTYSNQKFLEKISVDIKKMINIYNMDIKDLNYTFSLRNRRLFIDTIFYKSQIIYLKNNNVQLPIKIKHYTIFSKIPNYQKVWLYEFTHSLHCTMLLYSNVASAKKYNNISDKLKLTFFENMIFLNSNLMKFLIKYFKEQKIETGIMPRQLILTAHKHHCISNIKPWLKYINNLITYRGEKLQLTDKSIYDNFDHFFDNVETQYLPMLKDFAKHFRKENISELELFVIEQKTEPFIVDTIAQEHEKFGLDDFTYYTLINYFRTKYFIKIVRIYGSRASNENLRKSSDIDLLIEGIYNEDLLKIYKEEVKNLRIPYKIDIIDVCEYNRFEDFIPRVYSKSKIFYNISDYIEDNYVKKTISKKIELANLNRWQYRYINGFTVSFKDFFEFYDVNKDSDNLDVLNELYYLFTCVHKFAWKILGDYLKEQGIFVFTPRKIFKTAEQYKIIKNSKDWIDIIYDINIYKTEDFENVKDLLLNRLKQNHIVLIKKFKEDFLKKYIETT